MVIQSLFDRNLSIPHSHKVSNSLHSGYTTLSSHAASGKTAGFVSEPRRAPFNITIHSPYPEKVHIYTLSYSIVETLRQLRHCFIDNGMCGNVEGCPPWLGNEACQVLRSRVPVSQRTPWRHSARIPVLLVSPIHSGFDQCIISH